MSQLSEQATLSARRRTIPEALGRKLLELLAECRPHWLSLHDAQGEALWLSGGTIGPDEHSWVATAFEVFTLEPKRLCIQRRLDDGRRALFLAARDPLGGCSGVVFAPIDVIQADEQVLLTPAVKSLLLRFSMLLAPPVERRAPVPAMLVSDTGESAALAEGAAIHARSYTRLQPGGGTRRYEIAIPASGTARDAAVVARVAEWLAQHRQRYVTKPASFTVAVSASAAIDPEFARRIAQGMARAEVHEGMIILQVPAAAWAQYPQRLVPLLDACESVNYFVMLDDFELGDAALGVLRHKAVRMLKLRAELTTAAMEDRYSRALLASCLQIARVLGIHCVAKRVPGASAARWLATAGVDYVDPFNPSETASATTTGENVALQQVS